MVFDFIKYFIYTGIPVRWFCKSFFYGLLLFLPIKIEAQKIDFTYLQTEQKIDTLLSVPYNNLVENFNYYEKWYDEAIHLSESPQDKAKLLSLKSIISYYQGKYEQSTKENLSAIHIYDSLGCKKEVGTLYTQLGYQIKRVNLDKGIFFMRKGIQVLETLKDSAFFSAMYGNYGVLKEMKNELDSALLYYKVSLNYALKFQDSVGIPYAYNRLAIGYMLMGEYNKSVDAVTKSSSIRRIRNDEHGLVENDNVLGSIYLHFKEYDLAAGAFIQSLEGSRRLNYPFLIQDNLQNLSRCYAELRNYERAYYYFSQAATLKDSLLNEKTNHQITKLQEEFESEKKDREIVLLNKDNELSKASLQQKNMLVYSFLIVLILLFILSFFIYRSYRLKKRSHELITQKNTKLSIYNEKLIQQKSKIELQKELIETKNTEILDSIKYAKRIQTAILPSEKFVKEFLPQHFILYKPKDIVAGDFYWLECPPVPFSSSRQLAEEMSASSGQRRTVYFAAADCTGHGVPGAMVSVVCHNALNRSIREYGHADPGKILDKTCEIVVQEFEKSDEDVKDGMDISLVSLSEVKDKGGNPRSHTHSRTLKWAGANNPFWIIRQGVTEIEEIKPNKQPIGKVDNPQPFTTHTIELQKGDTIYIFTDGYQDQFGGPKGKKFKASQLKELLLFIQHKTMDEQKAVLQEAFENWKGDMEQVDDVCVIGVRL